MNDSDQKTQRELIYCVKQVVGGERPTQVEDLRLEPDDFRAPHLPLPQVEDLLRQAEDGLYSLCPYRGNDRVGYLISMDLPVLYMRVAGGEITETHEHPW